MTVIFTTVKLACQIDDSGMYVIVTAIDSGMLDWHDNDEQLDDSDKMVEQQ